MYFRMYMYVHTPTLSITCLWLIDNWCVIDGLLLFMERCLMWKKYLSCYLGNSVAPTYNYVCKYAHMLHQQIKCIMDIFTIVLISEVSRLVRCPD